MLADSFKYFLQRLPFKDFTSKTSLHRLFFSDFPTDTSFKDITSDFGDSTHRLNYFPSETSLQRPPFKYFPSETTLQILSFRDLPSKTSLQDFTSSRLSYKYRDFPSVTSPQTLASKTSLQTSETLPHRLNYTAFDSHDDSETSKTTLSRKL